VTGLARIAACGLLLAVAIPFAPARMSASTVTGAPPHDPARARGAIERFVALIDRNDYSAWLRRSDLVVVFTNEHGHVLGEQETRAFLAALNGDEAHPDRAPLGVASVRRLDDDRYNPLYLVRIERERWFAASEEEFNGLVPAREAGYRPSSETWLVQFSSNELSTFREVPELWRLTRERD
jgi:hypothetical protein